MSGPCCVDPGAKQIYEARGEEKEFDGIKTYQTGNGKSAIVFFTDIFGSSFINVRQNADLIAEKTNTTVLIPDYFHGDPMDPNSENLWDLLPEWLKKHPTTEACEIAEKFFSAIEGNFQSIQLMGFCYGAKVVVHFLIKENVPSKVKSGVVAHPSFLVEEEATQIKRKMLFLCAENESIFVPELRAKFESALTTNGLGTFLDFPGTTHGFSVRPDGTESVEKQRQKALEAAAEFFAKNI